MIITPIGGFFPTSMGYFFPQKWKFVIFFISQIGKHYTNVPNDIQVFKLKQHMTKLKYNYNNTNWGNFSHILGEFSQKRGRNSTKKSKVAFSNNNGKR